MDQPLKEIEKNGINCKLNKNISYIIPIKKKSFKYIISLPKLFRLFKLTKDIKTIIMTYYI